MTRPVQRRDVNDHLRDLETRLSALERRLRVPGDQTLPFDYVFSSAGAPTAGLRSGRLEPSKPGTIFEVHITAATAGSSDSAFGVYFNGTLIKTITLVAGDQSESAAIGQQFAPSDYLQVAVDTVGSGLDSPVVHLRGRLNRAV